MSGSSRPLRVGISACLLGERVRHDGGDKAQDWLIDQWGPHVVWVSVCPEVEVGMGTPREPVHLVGPRDSPSMVGVESDTDWTEEMHSFSQHKVQELAAGDVHAYVLKSGSPSCGLEVASGDGTTRGLFAAALIAALPALPVAQESDLLDVAFRDNFIEMMFAYQRLRWFFGRRRTPGELVLFHAQSRLQLQTHDVHAFENLSLFVTAGGAVEDVAAPYQLGFMEAMRRPSSRASHLEVMEEVVQLLEGHDDVVIDARSAVDGFKRHQVDLMQVIRTLGTLTRETEAPKLDGQTYLDPHLSELALRSLPSANPLG